MPRKDKKLLRWLVTCLNNKKFPRLDWTNKTTQLKELAIPWPRQKKKTWDEADSAVILDYIRMQGGYKEGEAKQYVTWKARFRTAINKEKALKFIGWETGCFGRRKIYRIVTDFDCDYNRSNASPTVSFESADIDVSSPLSSPESGYDSAIEIFEFDGHPYTEPTFVPDSISTDEYNPQIDELNYALRFMMGDETLTEIEGISLPLSINNDVPTSVVEE